MGLPVPSFLGARARWRCSNARTTVPDRTRGGPAARRRGSCSSAARPASARPRSCATFCAGRERRAVGRLRRAASRRARSARSLDVAGDGRRTRCAALVRGGVRPPELLPALLDGARAAVPCSCSRTCTGPTRRRSTSLRLLGPAASTARARAACVGTYRDDELDAAHPLRVALGDLRARRRLCGGWRAAVGGAVRELAGLAASTPRRCTRSRAATRSTSPRCWRRARRCPPTVRDAVLGRAARLEPRRARRAATRVAIVPGGRRAAAAAAARRRRATRRRASRSGRAARRGAAAIAFRHELARLAHRGRDPAAPARRAAPRARSPCSRRAGDPARLAHHAEAAGDARGRARATPPPAGERAARPRARTARRPRSTPAPCASPPALAAARARRAARAAAPTSATSTDQIDGGRSRRGARRWRCAPRGRRPAGARATRCAGSPAWHWFTRPQRARRRRVRRRGGRAAASRSSPAASWRWPTATARSWPCCADDRRRAPPRGASPRSSSPSGLGRHGDRWPTRSTTSAPPRPRSAEPASGARQARAQPRAGARARPRGARRPRLHATSTCDRRAPARRWTADRACSPTRIAYCAEHDLDSLALYIASGWRCAPSSRRARWDAAARRRRRGAPRTPARRPSAAI